MSDDEKARAEAEAQRQYAAEAMFGVPNGVANPADAFVAGAAWQREQDAAEIERLRAERDRMERNSEHWFENRKTWVEECERLRAEVRTLADHFRIDYRQIERAEAERDDLRATIERVRALVREARDEIVDGLTDVPGTATRGAVSLLNAALDAR